MNKLAADLLRWLSRQKPRLIQPVEDGVEVFTGFFVSFHPTQRKIVGWNKRSGSTIMLYTPYKPGLSVK